MLGLREVGSSAKYRALDEKAYSGEAGEKVGPHRKSICGQAGPNSVPCEAEIRAVEEHDGGEKSESDLDDQERQHTDRQQRIHQMIGLGGDSRSHPIDGEKRVDRIQTEQKEHGHSYVYLL